MRHSPQHILQLRTTLIYIRYGILKYTIRHSRIMINSAIWINYYNFFISFHATRDWQPLDNAHSYVHKFVSEHL